MVTIQIPHTSSIQPTATDQARFYPTAVTEELFNKRMGICQKCQYHGKTANFIGCTKDQLPDVKLRFTAASCPIGNW